MVRSGVFNWLRFIEMKGSPFLKSKRFSSVDDLLAWGKVGSQRRRSRQEGPLSLSHSLSLSRSAPSLMLPRKLAPGGALPSLLARSPPAGGGQKNKKAQESGKLQYSFSTTNYMARDLGRIKMSNLNTAI